MELLFLTASNVPLFTRSDAETATWQAEEMSLRLLFPYDKDKPAERGMRVFFRDADGAIQPYEIRKVRNFEPDHYQEITAEHIAISELTDRIFTQTDFDDVTAGSILSSLLTGTGWSVGNDTSSGTSSLKLSNTTVWDAIANIRTNWNVYITPRVTFTAAGITGKYLDIAPAAGIWNGLRLSINKNADDLGVTYDDTAVKTAIYGYGKQITEGSGSTAVKTITTFADTVWTATAEHPAKPAGQTYVEDPQATALYGRDGTPRFSFYQNSDIDDPALLLQKSWEYLKTVREPKVTIDCTIRDLYRLGYTDQPVRLHDIALVDVEPLGITLHREIIKLSIDLLDPLQTQVTIGDYIPNIVYIAKQTSHSASGGGGGGGQTAKEYKESEFETRIDANEYEISLKAYQQDLETKEMLLYSEISITASQIRSEVDDFVNSLHSTITQTASQIRSEVWSDINSIRSEIVQDINSVRVSVREKNAIYYGWYDPRSEEGGSHTCYKGDEWYQTNSVDSWADANAFTWGSMSSYDWAETAGGKKYTYDGSNWILTNNYGEDIINGAELIVTKDKIAGIVSDVDKNYSSLVQTASMIRSRVVDIQNGLSSTIEQTASQIRAEVQDSNNSLRAEFTITASEIKAEVESAQSDLAVLSIQSSQIKAEVTSAKSDYAALTIQSSQIKSEVSSAKSDYASLQITSSQIKSEVASAKSDYASLQITSSQIKSEVASAKSDYASLQITSSQIKSEVASAKSDYASLQITSSQIKSEVSSAKSDYASLQITSSQIKTEVSSAKSDLATLAVTANTIRGEVSDSLSNIGSLWIESSQIREAVSGKNTVYYGWYDPRSANGGNHTCYKGDEWYKTNSVNDWDGANALTWGNMNSYEWNEVAGGKKYTYDGTDWILTNSYGEDIINGAELTVTKDKITAVVSDVDKNYSSLVQTASMIRSRVIDIQAGLSSTIEQTASRIRAEVTDSNNSLRSVIEQTASQIRAEVSDEANSLRTEIVQNTSQIALRVTKGDVGTQLAVECGNVTISGGNLVIDGYVTAQAFQGVEAFINGTSSAAHIYANYYTVNNSLEAGNISLNASSGLLSAPKGYFGQGIEIPSGYGVKVGSYTATWQSKAVITGVTKSSSASRMWAYWNGSEYTHPTLNSSFLTNVETTSTTIYYLGR